MARKSGIELKKSTFKEKKMVGKWMEQRGIYKSLKANERGGGLKKSLAISEVVRGRRGNPLGWRGGMRGARERKQEQVKMHYNLELFG